MNSLLITRGLPASGKSMYARTWVAEDPSRRVRVNRDDLRQLAFGQPILDHAGETTVTVMQQAAVRALLQAGRDVIVDDTHLRAKYARQWADLAAEVGAAFAVVDFDTPLEVCLARDAARERPVGEQVIRGMHARFLASGGGFAPVTATDRSVSVGGLYVPDPGLPPAWIVDVDGTVALMRRGPGVRSPYDWLRVGEDLPNEPVIEIVTALANQADIVVMSGRDEVCRPETEAWLLEHGVCFDALFMRPAGDTRRDAVVKAELFWGCVAPRWRVVGVIDDRRQVVSMWRAMGLMCAQVAEGDF
jgi:predicted kinase